MPAKKRSEEESCAPEECAPDPCGPEIEEKPPKAKTSVSPSASADGR